MAFGRMGARGGFGSMGAPGGKPHGGPFLFLFDGSSKALLFNATDRLLITGSDPVAASSGTPIGLLLALTNP